MVHKSVPCHKTNYRAGRSEKVGYLVVHYVGATGSAENNARYYGTTADLGASAHYFVGHAAEGGAVWASVPEGDTAWHCGAKKYLHPACRNGNSIGVELCCHKAADGSWYFDAETLDAAAELCRDICARYGIDKDHVLRHYDVTGKVCPAPFVHDTEAWARFKERIFTEETPAAPGAEPWYTATMAWGKEHGVCDGTRATELPTRAEVTQMCKNTYELVVRTIKDILKGDM